MHSCNLRVSYYAAGVLANLCALGPVIWSDEFFDFDAISAELVC